MTAIEEGAEQVVVRCWCCGDTFGSDRVVRLGDHPEVSLCVGCAHWAHLRGREIEDLGRGGFAVQLRGFMRRGRAIVMRRGWHRSRVAGPALRRIGRHLP